MAACQGAAPDGGGWRCESIGKGRAFGVDARLHWLALDSSSREIFQPPVREGRNPFRP